MKNQENKVQVTGVATATVNGNGNGNGNGKKVKAETKPIDNVKVDENFDSKNSIKITPHFPFMTTKGVEMFTDMGNLENAKLFIDDLAMKLDNDTADMTGLLMILDAIRRKLNGEDSDYLGAEDYINWLQDYIFHWTATGNDCTSTYINAVRSGNFVVGETRDDKGEVWAEGIYPPKHKVKQSENALRSEINALAETVKELQFQMTGKPATDPKFTKPADFEGLWLGEVFSFDWMIPNWTLLLEVQQFPGEQDSRIISSVYEKRMDGSVGLDIERLPDSKEEYPYSHEDGVKKLKSESFDPNNGEGDTLDELSGGMLAQALSDLLKNPNLPRDIYEGIAEGINEISNGRGNERIIYNSPEYIEKVLEFHEYTEERKAEKKVAENPANETDVLAVKIAEIINDSNTPPEIYEGLMEGLTNTFNHDIDQTEFTEYEKSPAYIARLIRGYQKKQERAAA